MKDRFENWRPPKIEHGKLTKWNWMVQNPEGLKLGKKTDIGAFTYINSAAGVLIGDNVQIGSHCSIYSVNTIDNTRGAVCIGENSCLGSHCVVLPGVNIGKNSIIGAFSLVNKDVPENVVAFGIPARVVKVRT